MPMTRSAMLNLKCEFCTSTSIYTGEYLQDCKRQARKDGWIVGNHNKCYCPRHTTEEFGYRIPIRNEENANAQN